MAAAATAAAGPALWAEQHRPTSEAELVVQKKKVAEVRDFLVGPLARSRRLLVLRGPPGCGKAAVLHGLCADLGFEVLEWSPASKGSGAASAAPGGALRPEPLGDAFLRFLAQTDRYRAVGSGEVRRPRVSLVRDFPFTLLDTGRGEGRGRGTQFLERFRDLVQGGAVHRAALCFNETLEDHRVVQRLLSQVDASAVVTVHFDGVPRTFAQRALDAIARAEGLDPGAARTAVLAAECGGDLRQAINALQLLAGGLPRAPPAGANGKAPKRAPRGGTRGRGKEPPATATQGDVDGTPPGAGGAAAADDTNMRASSLGLFHALGRLLYSKRVPPAEGLQDACAPAVPSSKRVRRNGSAAPKESLEPRQLPAHLLIPKCTRPPLYFVPEEVIDSSNSEPSSVVDWVFTNAPRFFGDVADLAEFGTALANADAWGSHAWRPGASESIASPMDGLAAAVQVRAMLDANLHPVPPTFGDPCGAAKGDSQAAAFNMVRPLMRDVARHRDRRHEQLNAYLEVAGPKALNAVTAGQTLVLRTLPFVHLMLSASRGSHATLRHLPHALMQLLIELSALDGSTLRAAPPDDGGAAFGAARAAAEAPPPAAWATPLPEDPIEDF